LSDELFRAVTTSRLSSVIVEQIRALIREERLRPGDRLPSERELGAHLGASRVTLREALRVLRADGLVEPRVGTGGGWYVTRPSPRRLGVGLAQLLENAAGSPADITEARLVFELQLVPLVVERATARDIDELGQMADAQIAGLRTGPYQASRSALFHVQVGACAHNSAIDMLVNSFYDPMVLALRAAKDASPLMGEQGAQEHRQFVDAISARDVDQAMTVMRRHITRTAERLAAPQPA
jgi:GntR family transcriptional repressor for pyruvate dehydrogenase complex